MPGSSFTPTSLGHEENEEVGQPSRANALQISRTCIADLRVVRASDSRPEGLGSMLDVTKYPPSAHGVRAR
ncbi:hypothetical protein TNCV_3027551 [Trichonephila clavipes]|nr:hypothetical protein TNCV_3027551 [Trichonephila clavipes]